MKYSIDQLIKDLERMKADGWELTEEDISCPPVELHNDPIGGFRRFTSGPKITINLTLFNHEKNNRIILDRCDPYRV